MSRWRIHHFRRLLPPEMSRLLSISCLQAQQSPFRCPARVHTAADAEPGTHTHRNAKHCGICPHSNVHLFAFSQSILEHASTAVPEIILANSIAYKRQRPRESFDFSDLRARKRDHIIWLKLTVNLRETVVICS